MKIFDSMKTYLSKLMAVALMGIFAAQLPAFADDDDDLASSFGTRYSAGIDKKIIKGLHVDFEEELRLDGISALDKSYTSIGVSWKVLPFLPLLRLTLSCSLIFPPKNKKLKNHRTRAAGETTALYPYIYIWFCLLCQGFFGFPVCSDAEHLCAIGK